MTSRDKLVVLTVDLEVPMPCKHALIKNKTLFKECLELVREWCHRLLRKLKKMHITATFFTEGFLARLMPELVAEVAEEGHEIACHGHYHYPLVWLSIDKAREEVRKARRTLEDVLGRPPLGFRAPRFMVNQKVLQVLEDEGFLYDSSIVPFWRPRRYRHLWVPRLPFFPTPKKKLIELPVSVVNMLRLPLGLPWMNRVGGSLFFKLLKLFGTTNPIVIYLHLHDLPGKGLKNLLSLLTYLRRRGVFIKAISLVSSLVEGRR